MHFIEYFLTLAFHLYSDFISGFYQFSYYLLERLFYIRQIYNHHHIKILLNNSLRNIQYVYIIFSKIRTYLCYVAERFYPHIRQLSREEEFVYDRIAINTTPKDVLLVYSVWPCTKKTIRVAELAHNLGIPMILITNTSLNPLVKIADVVIDTNSVNHPSGDTALMLVTEALMSELGRRTAPESTKNIEKIEQALNDNGLILWEN